MDDFGAYVIVSRPELPYSDIARICVDEGIKMVQLREKELSDREVIAAAEQMLAATEGTDTLLVINDRPDIAAVTGAPAVHLGQEDMDIETAGKILPKETVIGLSTHNLRQLSEALQLKPDYVGFGPVYRTTTKKKPDPVVGTAMLSQALALSEVPVVAIGGIFPENLNEVLSCGAKNLCMVRYLMETGEKTAKGKRDVFIRRLRWLSEALSKGAAE